MIRIEHIWKTFTMGEQVLHALRDVSETITNGEHVAIMGPSGSGKSTLLNILGCLDRPTQGAYYLNENRVENLSEADLAQIRLREIGFIFQSFHLIPRLDALGNVELPMTLGGVGRDERRERALHALRAVGLDDRAKHRPAELSGGQKQRVAIARATVMEPRILLADEPTGNLDSNSGRQVLDLLENLNHNGITLIVVTHDPNVARRAQRTIVLRDGMILRRLPASEITDLATLFSPLSDAETATAPTSLSSSSTTAPAASHPSQRDEA